MKIHRLFVIALAGLLGVFAALGAARADQDEDEKSPMQIVRENSEQVLAILRDPELEGDKKEEERHEKVREAVANNFDWSSMARRSLGRHWRNLDDGEREEFTGLFRKLLEQIYIKRIEEHATDAEVSYIEQKIEDDTATVVTRATKGGRETPILYIMRKYECEDDEEEPECPAWLIYDVKVEGVSLLLNYREQFNEIIVGSGFDTLIRKLKKKVGAD